MALRDKQWFLDRVGKTVYRDYQPTDSIFAKKLGYKPTTIHDADHAQYMFDIQSDMYADGGVIFNYRDTKEVNND